MKYPYHFTYSQLGSPLMRFPEGMEPVMLFLYCDVDDTGGKHFILEAIDRVLQGEIPVSEVGGNVYALTVRPDFTTIVDRLAKFTGTPGVPYVIETSELREIILIWLKAKARKPFQYSCQVEFTTFGSPILRLSKEIELVSSFLFCEVEDPMGSDSHLEEIEAVLQGQVPEFQMQGNIHQMIVKEDFTTISHASGGNQCLIETDQFKNLILAWLELKRQLSYEKEANAAKERTTDPALVVPTQSPEKSLSSQEHLSTEQKEQASEVLC